MINLSAAQFPVRRVTPAEAKDTNDMLAVEEPLEIQLVFGPQGRRTKKTISITMRTPGQDDELALGFLFTEGIIRSEGEIQHISNQSDSGNVILIEFQPGISPGIESLDRHFYTTSSCGVCGKTSLDAVRSKSVFAAGLGALKTSSALLHSLQEKLKGHQKVFDLTGGLHASALFDANGNLTLVREDVGRHNALDKVIGASLVKHQLPLSESILLLSGRISFELIQKAYMSGINFVAAIGAPSTLAVKMAEECSMTLVGFLRENRYTVYSGNQRLAN